MISEGRYVVGFHVSDSVVGTGHAQGIRSCEHDRSSTADKSSRWVNVLPQLTEMGLVDPNDYSYWRGCLAGKPKGLYGYGPGPFWCPVEGCDKLFIRNQCSKRHILFVHSSETRETIPSHSISRLC